MGEIHHLSIVLGIRLRWIIQSTDYTLTTCNECDEYLISNVTYTTAQHLSQVAENYEAMTTAFFCEDYRVLKRTTLQAENQRKYIKRQRRKQIIALRRIDPVLSVEKGTWYFFIINSLSQMDYCLKRMGEPCREHVGNNFSPVPRQYVNKFQSVVKPAHTFRNAYLYREDECVSTNWLYRPTYGYLKIN